MNFTIYLDAFFLVNWIMNVIILFIMKKLLRLQTHFLKVLTGGMIGGVGAILTLIIPNCNLILKFLFMYIGIVGIMVLVSFGFQNIKQWILWIGCFYFIGFLLGGFLTFLYYRMDVRGYIYEVKKSKVFSQWRIEYFFLCVFGMVISISVMNRIYAYFKRNITTHYEIELIKNQKAIKGIGFMDTGNCLKDWVSNQPVVIVEYSFIQNILEEKTKKRIEEFLCIGQEQMSVKETEVEQLRFIPYHSLGNEHGMLVGMYIDNLRLFTGGKVKDNKNALVGLYQGTLSANKEYQVILHKEIMT